MNSVLMSSLNKRESDLSIVNKDFQSTTTKTSATTEKAEFRALEAERQDLERDLRKTENDLFTSQQYQAVGRQYQPKKWEIEDALSYLGKRPVEWCLENLDLNERYHLVHATHLTEEETEGIANSGANVVLCPTTEGNLGDGLFPLTEYQDAGG